MFTVKVIYPNGLEIVTQTNSIMLRPPEESATGHSCLTYFEAGKDESPIDIFEGIVYLMNENGKTVANYCLNHPTDSYK